MEHRKRQHFNAAKYAINTSKHFYRAINKYGWDQFEWKVIDNATTQEELDAHSITALPGSLSEAVKLLEQDEVIKDALGAHIFEKFVEAKHAEYDEYRLAVHEWELKRYMSLL